MDPREFYKLVREMSVAADDETITLYDSFDLELSEDFVVETGVVGFTEDGVIVEADESTLEFLELNNVLLEDEKLEEKMIMGASSDASDSGSFKMGEADELDELKKLALGRTVDEAKYHGRKVSLGKPFLTPDGPKKRSVYVKKPNGKVVKVNFGDKKMRIKKSNPARRKSFRARHRCENPGPRWKARYWACKTW